MTHEEQKDIVRAYFEEVWNKNDLQAGYRFRAREAADHDLTWVPMWRKAMPDMHMALDALYAEGDFVTVVMRITGTHKGVLEGEVIDWGIITQPLQPSGNRIEFISIGVFEFRDGKMYRAIHGVLDWLTCLRQMGALPTPA